MDTFHILTSKILSNEALDDLIQNCTCVDNLSSLLQLKHQRILDGSCAKFDFHNDCMYKTNVNVELATQVLKYMLLVVPDKSPYVQKSLNYCLDLLTSHEKEVFYALNLLNVIFDDFKIDHNSFDFTERDFKRFQEGLLAILNRSKVLTTFTLIYVFPNYLEVCNVRHKHTLLSNLFNFIKNTKKLEVMCVCFDKFINFTESDFCLLRNDDFWLLLMDCIIDKQHFLRKQGVYLLSRSIHVLLSHRNSALVSKFISCDNPDKTWENYLILLDVSNEKQLHIVEPSLCLFNSIKNLDFLWRQCLYKLFLNHSQNAVVYKTAIYIIQNEREWQNFSKIGLNLLTAINKNEYTADTTQIFEELGLLCAQLDANQLETFLSNSLQISWIPTSIWGFYSNVFSRVKQPISLPLLEKLINKLKMIPHKFIRSGCTKILLDYFVEKFLLNSPNEVFRIGLLLDCDELLFERLLTNNEKKIQTFSDQLKLHFSKMDAPLHEIKVSIKILQFLKTTFPTDGNNLFHLLLLEEPQREMEDFLLERLNRPQNLDELTHLLLLNHKLHSPKLLSERASEILADKQINSFQAVLAFDVLFKHSEKSHKSLIKIWKDRFRTEDQITQIVVEILLTCNSTHEEEVLPILEDVFDCQNMKTIITIIENLKNILQYVDQSRVFLFVEKCFDAFVVLIKTNCGNRRTTKKFVSQLLQSRLIETKEFREKLVAFLQELLKISNSANSVAYILTESLVDFISANPKTGIVFISVIVKLILHGIVVNKTDRVDYHVFQEIGLALQSDDTPNHKEMLTKLWAFECVLILTDSTSNNAKIFIFTLIQKYRKHFGKRYFPDSQIHLEKLRILQTLILIHNYVDEKTELVDLLVESFVEETHQPSVRHLMQCLLVLLTKNESSTFIASISEKLKSIDNNRSSTVSGLIPVVYHLVVNKDENEWDQLMEVLLPYTMGAQFKLRIFSQVALIKMYEKSIKLNYSRFAEKYKHIYYCLKHVITATASNNFDVANIHHEFLDYFDVKKVDFSTALHTIPKQNGVTQIEWENLRRVSARLKRISFNHNDSDLITTSSSLKHELQASCNIQKKITPWKELLNAERGTENRDFILVTSLIEKPTNLGGLSRTCEVFGIKSMVMRTSKITSDREFKSLSMSSENWVNITEVKVENLLLFLLSVIKEGYSLIGAEQTSESVTLEKFQFPKRTVLVLGNEKEGIPADLIPLFDTCIEIPQFGMVRSLNVHVAGAIVMWEYCKQHKL